MAPAFFLDPNSFLSLPFQRANGLAGRALSTAETGPSAAPLIDLGWAQDFISNKPSGEAKAAGLGPHRAAEI